MKDSTSICITGYSCPLCGKWHDERYYYMRQVAEGLDFIYDHTPCCKVVSCWAEIDQTFVYVGTFRNTDECVQWVMSAGRSIGWNPVGSEWDVEKQDWNNGGYDEIPF